MIVIYARRKERVSNIEHYYTKDFYDCIADIVESEEVQRLADYNQHGFINRLEHSLRVSYYSYLVCKKWGLNYRAAARGGLLHDLFYEKKWVLNEFGEYTLNRGLHAFQHPKQALTNAERLCALNGLERDIIAKHMFPLCFGMPRHRESHIVSIVDKICATNEALVTIRLLFSHRKTMGIAKFKV